MEENRRVYEVLDLGFGKCRMCVCGPDEARELLQHHEMIRVTSKYPNIARDFFYNRKHQTVDIIKLNGSVELGPIVSLGDVIVDIVETGSTLKENGLAVLEEVLPRVREDDRQSGIHADEDAEDPGDHRKCQRLPGVTADRKDLREYENCKA